LRKKDTAVADTRSCGHSQLINSRGQQQQQQQQQQQSAINRGSNSKYQQQQQQPQLGQLIN
jgi:hypothetical protein